MVFFFFPTQEATSARLNCCSSAVVLTKLKLQYHTASLVITDGAQNSEKLTLFLLQLACNKQLLTNLAMQVLNEKQMSDWFSITNAALTILVIRYVTADHKIQSTT